MDTVGMTQSAIPAPFDKVAHAYDREFSETILGRWMRAATWRFLADAFKPGDRVLDLGCGTGRDARMLARQGVHVTAVDQSHAMLDIAGEEVERARLERFITLTTLDLAVFDPERLSELQDELMADRFDGAYSNFGALNCLSDLRPLAESLARLIRKGGRMILVVMGPDCAWEIAWHLLHRDPRRAFRRNRRGVKANAGRGESVEVWYPSPSKLCQAFERDFIRLETAPIGSFLPPSYLSALVERRLAFFERLARLEERTRSLPFLPNISDHYLVVLQRR
jgi:SAM-dependent methyltransferase